MSRPLRIDFAGALHHVMARGNEKTTIYLDDRDRERFLEILDDVGSRLGWRVWAYCLMHTHYHLLVESPAANLTRGMRDLNGSYAQSFNRRHDRVGHLFQGRYKALLVDREAYALQVIRYIVRNPVRSGVCATPSAWRWSSHREILGSSPGIAVLDVHSTLSFFGPAESARQRYDAFVAIPVDDEPAAPVANRGLLGDQNFVDSTAGELPASPSAEVSRAERVFKPLSRYAAEHRDRKAAILAAYRDGAFTQVAIARHFGVHYSTVCRLVRADQRQDSRPDPNHD